MPWTTFPSQMAAARALKAQGLTDPTISRLTRGLEPHWNGFEARRCGARDGGAAADDADDEAGARAHPSPPHLASTLSANARASNSTLSLEPSADPRAAAEPAGRAAVFYFVNEAPTSRAARMEAAADAAAHDGDPGGAARWRARAAAQRAVAARLPHGGRPNIEWEVSEGEATAHEGTHGGGRGGLLKTRSDDSVTEGREQPEGGRCAAATIDPRRALASDAASRVGRRRRDDGRERRGARSHLRARRLASPGGLEHRERRVHAKARRACHASSRGSSDETRSPQERDRPNVARARARHCSE